MSIQVGDNFKYLGKKPIDDRMLYATLSEMVSIPETSLYEGCKAYVIATGKEYQYKSGNTVDVNTGKWRDTEVDLSQYYNKSETDNLLSGKVDKVNALPELTADINGNIYQYVGSDETTYKTGHFYKAIYVRRISWLWSSSNIIGYTLQHKDDIKIGDTFYRNADCTDVYGTVSSGLDNYGHINVSTQYGNSQTSWANSSHTISEDIRWKDVSTEINDSQASSASTYSSSKIENLIPTDISDLTDSTGVIPSEVKDLSDVQVGSSIADDDVLAWDSEEEKFVNKPQSGGGASDFDDLTNRPQESDTIDIEDLDLPMPAKPTEYPILFDESGGEYQVGLYKRSIDGKVKPVWRKDVECGTLPNATVKNIPHNISNLDTVLSVDGIAYSIDTYKPLPLVYPHTYVNYNTSLDVNGTYVVLNTTMDRSGFSGRVSIFFTKTTDEWKEV